MISIHEIRKEIIKNISHDKYSMLVHSNGKFTLIGKSYDWSLDKVNCSYSHYYNSILVENMDSRMSVSDRSESDTLKNVECVLSSYDLINWNFPMRDVLKVKEGYNPELGYVLDLNK